MTMERDKNYTPSMSRPCFDRDSKAYIELFRGMIKNVLNVLSIESEMTYLYVDVDIDE